jgi:hypothetical protein
LDGILSRSTAPGSATATGGAVAVDLAGAVDLPGAAAGRAVLRGGGIGDVPITRISGSVTPPESPAVPELFCAAAILGCSDSKTATPIVTPSKSRNTQARQGSRGS